MAQLQDIEEMLDRMVTDTELLSDSGALARGHSPLAYSTLWPLCVAAAEPCAVRSTGIRAAH